MLLRVDEQRHDRRTDAHVLFLVDAHALAGKNLAPPRARRLAHALQGPLRAGPEVALEHEELHDRAEWDVLAPRNTDDVRGRLQQQVRSNSKLHFGFVPLEAGPEVLPHPPDLIVKVLPRALLRAERDEVEVSTCGDGVENRFAFVDVVLRLLGTRLPRVRGETVCVRKSILAHTNRFTLIAEQLRDLLVVVMAVPLVIIDVAVDEFSSNLVLVDVCRETRSGVEQLARASTNRHDLVRVCLKEKREQKYALVHELIPLLLGDQRRLREEGLQFRGDLVRTRERKVGLCRPERHGGVVVWCAMLCGGQLLGLARFLGFWCDVANGFLL